MPAPYLPHFGVITERESGLRRTLTSAQLAMIAIGGAIGTGLFLGSGLAIGFAGPAVLLSYLLGALITLLLMGCLAEMTAAHPTSGSFGAWAEFYLSPLAGFLVRYAYWAAIVLALGTEVSAVAVYIHFWLPALPGWIPILLFAAVLIAVNSSTVQLFGTVEYLFSALKIAAILLFLALGAWLLFAHPHAAGTGLANFTQYGGFLPHGLTGAWTAVLVALFSFFSVEMVAVAAGEAADPRKAILHAFRATFLRLVLFYLGSLAVILAILPWTLTQQSGSIAQSPFVLVMARTGIPHAAGAVNFVLLIAALSAMNSQLYIATRMFFSLARAGFAPAVFGRVSRRGVPIPALFAATAGILIAAVLSVTSPGRAFIILLSVSSFGALYTWLMIFITHLSFRVNNRETSSAFRIWGYPWTTLLGILLMLAAMLWTLHVPAFSPTLNCGVPFLVLLTIAYLIRTRSLPSYHPDARVKPSTRIPTP